MRFIGDMALFIMGKPGEDIHAFRLTGDGSRRNPGFLIPLIRFDFFVPWALVRDSRFLVVFLVLVLGPLAFVVGFVSKFHFEKIVQSFETDLVVQDLELPISV